MENCKGCEYLKDDETCGAFECNGTECPELPCEKYGDQWCWQYSEDEWNAIVNDPNRIHDVETELEVIE